MTAGAPTKLTEELIEKAKSYMKSCIDTPQYSEKGTLSYVEVNLPTKVGLARFLGINKDTITEWCKEEYVNTHILAQQFSVIVKEISEEQEKRLINNGLGGLYKEKTTGMLLSKHGYAEKTETDITSKGERIDMSDPKLLELAKEYERKLKENIT